VLEKKTNYTLKEKNLLKLLKKNNFLEKSFGRFLCYSVKASCLYSSIKKIQSFLLKIKITNKDTNSFANIYHDKNQIHLFVIALDLGSNIIHSISFQS
jgi:hypothetical protein